MINIKNLNVQLRVAISQVTASDHFMSKAEADNIIRT